MYIPANYKEINIKNGFMNPSQVKNVNTAVFNFWERSLFQRACSTIKINTPKEWEGEVKDFLYYCLFKYGYVSVWEDAEFGKTFNPATLSGQNFYYQPVFTLVSNPALKESKKMKIGEECELLRLTPDYMGIWDIISYYAEKLATLDNAINMSIINNKLAYIIGVRNKTAGIAVQKIFDKINKGEPTVVTDVKLLNDPTDKDSPWQFLERQNLKNSYLTTDQLADFQTILNNFDAEVGIPSIPYQKKERLVTSEAESRMIDSTSRSMIWFETLQSSIEKIKMLYPDISLSVELRYDPEEIREEDEDGTDNIDRTL